MNADSNIADAVASYLTHESKGKNAGKLSPGEHQELHRFGRDFETYAIRQLTPAHVESYAASVISHGGDVKGRLEPVKGFLVYVNNYLKKEGFPDRRLASHVKIPRSSVKMAAVKPQFETIDMTESGLEALKDELAGLKARRPDIVEAIRIAAADKDYRENAPLDAAKDEQGRAEDRIRELEDIIRHAAVVDAQPRTAQAGARLGCVVTLHDVATEGVVSYTLVDSFEANPSEKKVSVTSPIGEALVGRSAGETVDVKTPKGSRSYRIEAVDF